MVDVYVCVCVCVCVCVYICMPSCFSCVQLFATPWTAAYQAPLSMGFSRQEYWSVLPFPSPEDLPHPGLKPTSLVSSAQWCLQGLKIFVRHWAFRNGHRCHLVGIPHRDNLGRRNKADAQKRELNVEGCWVSSEELEEKDHTPQVSSSSAQTQQLIEFPGRSHFRCCYLAFIPSSLLS